MIKAVIADSELRARQRLRRMLARQSDIEVRGESATSSETLRLVCSTSPDLLFLDIRMPDTDGFDLLHQLSERIASMPHVIFTTAHDQYAVRAFDCNVVDYLLKPFTAVRLRDALERVRSRMHFFETDRQVHRAPRESDTNRFVYRSRGRILFLPIDDIQWIYAEEGYLRVCAGGESHLIRETMCRLEERLDPRTFVRVHRSCIVNLQYIKEVTTGPGGESRVILTGGEIFAMSRGYRVRIDRLLHR